VAALEIPIAHVRDVERARRHGHALATAQGFSRVDAECVALAVSELATNLLRYARGGVIRLSADRDHRGSVVELECTDCGPGIANVEQAMQDGFSTSGGLGHGLPAARRLMDEFHIASGPAGTRIVARKWSR
jgi:serine/threonine-protein kinase RsbT